MFAFVFPNTFVVYMFHSTRTSHTVVVLSLSLSIVLHYCICCSTLVDSYLLFDDSLNASAPLVRLLQISSLARARANDRTAQIQNYLIYFDFNCHQFYWFSQFSQYICLREWHRQHTHQHSFTRNETAFNSNAIAVPRAKNQLRRNIYINLISGVSCALAVCALYHYFVHFFSIEIFAVLFSPSSSFGTFGAHLYTVYRSKFLIKYKYVLPRAWASV